MIGRLSWRIDDEDTVKKLHMRVQRKCCGGGMERRL